MISWEQRIIRPCVLHLFYLFYTVVGTARSSKKQKSSTDYFLRSSYNYVTSLLSRPRREPSESDHNRKYVGVFFVLKQANNIGYTLIHIHAYLPRFLRPAQCSEVRLQLAGFVTVQRVKILLTRNPCKGALAACIQTLLGTLIILCPAGIRNMIWLLAMGHQTGTDRGLAGHHFFLKPVRLQSLSAN